MLSRRRLLRAACHWAAMPAAAMTVSACSGREVSAGLTARLRRPLATSTGDWRLEAVRCATLAANGHNTQPWTFHLEPSHITLRPDFSRRTPAVDPDDHHLWVSLGCAAENLVVAAEALGQQVQVRHLPEEVLFEFSKAPLQRTSLTDAICRRQCTRAEYDGQPLPTATLSALQRAGSRDGVEVRLLTGRTQLEAVTGYVLQGNSSQMQDPAFVRELKQWIRFDDAQAAASADGLFTRSSGNPATPPWLASRLFGLLFTQSGENDRYVKHLRSSAGVAVFSGASADPRSWFEVGRAYQRFALTATSLEVRNAFVNQPVEVPAVRQQFSQWLGAPHRRPDLVVRFGKGPLLPYSFRRLPQQVIV